MISQQSIFVLQQFRSQVAFMFSLGLLLLMSTTDSQILLYTFYFLFITFQTANMTIMDECPVFHTVCPSVFPTTHYVATLQFVTITALP